MKKRGEKTQTKINILGIPFNVNKEKDLKNNDGGSLYGKIDYENHTISICDIYIKEQQDCTLIHEILHGIDDLTRIKLKEKLIVPLGVGLYNVLKNNKEFFIKYIQEL